MRKRFVSFFLALLAFSLPASNASAKNYLWKISSDRGVAFYLQGSIHLLKASDYPLAPAIETAYRQSDELVLEVDMAKMLDPATQQKLLRAALLPEGKSLKDVASPESYRLLSERFAKTGLPIETLSRTKPWFAVMTLTILKMQALGFDPEKGVDRHFFDKAKKDEKPVLGLELPKEQIELFDELDRTDAYVKSTLKELDVLESMMNDVRTAWRAGDVKTLDRILEKSFEEFPAFRKRFLSDRNKRWAEKLRTMAKDGKTRMVVVGAGHVGGPDGLIALLRKQGFVAEQL